MCIKKNLAKLTSLLLLLPLSGFSNVSYAMDTKISDSQNIKEEVNNDNSNVSGGNTNSPEIAPADNNPEQNDSSALIIENIKNSEGIVSTLSQETNLSQETKNTLKKAGVVALGGGSFLLMSCGVYYIIKSKSVNSEDMSPENPEGENDIDVEKNFSN